MGQCINTREGSGICLTRIQTNRSTKNSYFWIRHLNACQRNIAWVRYRKGVSNQIARIGHIFRINRSQIQSACLDQGNLFVSREIGSHTILGSNIATGRWCAGHFGGIGKSTTIDICLSQCIRRGVGPRVTRANCQFRDRATIQGDIGSQIAQLDISQSYITSIGYFERISDRVTLIHPAIPAHVQCVSLDQGNSGYFQIFYDESRRIADRAADRRIARHCGSIGESAGINIGLF